MCDGKVIGYWIHEKKRQKFNWLDFENICKEEGLTLKMIDVHSSLESQEPIHVFLHKLTDILAHAENGDKNAEEIISRVQGYIDKHPDLIVIDPFEKIRNVRNRFLSYELVKDGMQLDDIFVPNSILVNTDKPEEILSLMKTNGVEFPFLSKPLLAHGSSNAHQMMIIFNEKGLKDCQLPCVAQNFVNHNAILYKVFIVDNHFHIVERPSLKNFYRKDCTVLDTIFFNSNDISKSNSNSKWSIISEEDAHLGKKPKYEIMEKIVREIIKIFGLILLGVDIVIENHTGKYAIIDVNVFPGYDRYPNFFKHLTAYMKKRLKKEENGAHISHESSSRKCLSNDCFSGFKSRKENNHFVV